MVPETQEQTLFICLASISAFGMANFRIYSSRFRSTSAIFRYRYLIHGRWVANLIGVQRNPFRLIHNDTNKVLWTLNCGRIEPRRFQKSSQRSAREEDTWFDFLNIPWTASYGICIGTELNWYGHWIIDWTMILKLTDLKWIIVNMMRYWTENWTVGILYRTKKTSKAESEERPWERHLVWLL